MGPWFYLFKGCGWCEMIKAVDHCSIEKTTQQFGSCPLDIRNVKGSEQTLNLIQLECHWNGDLTSRKTVSFSCLCGALLWLVGELPGADRASDLHPVAHKAMSSTLLSSSTNWRRTSLSKLPDCVVLWLKGQNQSCWFIFRLCKWEWNLKHFLISKC